MPHTFGPLSSPSAAAWALFVCVRAAVVLGTLAFLESRWGAALTTGEGASVTTLQSLTSGTAEASDAEAPRFDGGGVGSRHLD